MPHLRSISTTRYRSFAKRTTLELRPLTLLYGGNSAGKSALLRLLPLLADSLREGASSPLDLSGLAGNNGAYRDIVWKRPVDGHRDLEVGLAWDASDLIDEAWYRIRYSDDRRQPVVEELSLARRGDVQLLAQRIPESRERSGAPLVYEVTVRGQTHPPQVWTFTGLIPSAASDLEAVKQLRALLVSLSSSLALLVDEEPRDAAKPSPQSMSVPNGAPASRRRSAGVSPAGLAELDPRICAARI
jgi:hypothetical protein